MPKKGKGLSRAGMASIMELEFMGEKFKNRWYSSEGSVITTSIEGACLVQSARSGIFNRSFKPKIIDYILYVAD